MGVAKDDNRSREVRQGEKLRQRSRGSCVNDRRRCVVERPEERGMCVNDKGRRAVKKAGTRGGGCMRSTLGGEGGAKRKSGGVCS